MEHRGHDVFPVREAPRRKDRTMSRGRHEGLLRRQMLCFGVLALACAAASCGDTRSRGHEQFLYYYLRGEVNTLDPARGNLEHEKSVQAQMYEPL